MNIRSTSRLRRSRTVVVPSPWWIERLRHVEPEARWLTWNELLAGYDEPIDFAVLPTDASEDLLTRLSTLSRLHFLQLLSAGYDDIVSYVPPTTQVFNARGVHDIAVAEWILGHLIAEARLFGEFADSALVHQWQPRTSRTLRRARVGLVGYGSIARQLETMLQPFSVHVARIGRDPSTCQPLQDLSDVATRSDYLVLLLPLSPATEGVVDRSVLRALPDGAIVVNAARGRLIDEDALVDEVSSGRIRAVLDVARHEPLPPDSPLWGVPGLAISPHVAARTDDIVARQADFAELQLQRLLDGDALANWIEIHTL